MRRVQTVLFISLLLWGSVEIQVFAAELTAETYVRVDIAARRATLIGMEKRLGMLQRKTESTTQALAEEASSRDVEAVFRQYGTTGAAHAAYGTHHRKAVDAWLANHPELQQEYADLTNRFEMLSRQLDALRQGN